MRVDQLWRYPVKSMAGVLLDIRARFAGTFVLNAWAARSGTITVGDVVTQVDEPIELEPPRVGRFA